MEQKMIAPVPRCLALPAARIVSKYIIRENIQNNPRRNRPGPTPRTSAIALRWQPVKAASSVKEGEGKSPENR